MQSFFFHYVLLYCASFNTSKSTLGFFSFQEYLYDKQDEKQNTLALQEDYKVTNLAKYEESWLFALSRYNYTCIED